MALNEMTENVEVVQTLSTYPNQEDGLSAEELKAKFDQGSKMLKEYINSQMVPAVRELERVMNPGMTYNGYNQVVSELGFSYGKGNFVGLMGYYYSNIDFEAKTITLSTKQDVADAEGIQATWAVGDKVTIINDRQYDRCSTITAINGNVITVDSLPFTTIVNASDSDWHDYTIFVPEKPEAGIVDLGKYAAAIGEGNHVHERAASAIGKANLVQGKYGVALGRDNFVKAYGGVAAGFGNIIEAEAQGAFAEGADNTATAPMAHAGGGASKATATGADSRGYKCEVDGEWGLARNYKTKVIAPYAVALNEETSAEAKGSLAAGKGTRATAQYQAVFGKYNRPSTNYLLNVGMGTSDTNRANAFVVRKDGITDVFGHRIQNVADAVNALDAVNLQTLNAKAAPAGLVSKVVECTSSEAVDNAIKTEWATMADNSIRHIVLALNGGDYGLHSGNWHVTLNQTDYAYGTVTAINYYYGGIAAQRCVFDGVWGDWEWVNPPMVAGVEYRTTERWNKKAVYTQLVNFGACPLSSRKSLEVKIDSKTRPTMVVDISGVLFDDTDMYENIDGASGVSVEYGFGEDVYDDWDNIDEEGDPTTVEYGYINMRVTTTDNTYEYCDVYFTLKYTKD